MRTCANHLQPVPVHSIPLPKYVVGAGLKQLTQKPIPPILI